MNAALMNEFYCTMDCTLADLYDAHVMRMMRQRAMSLLVVNTSCTRIAQRTWSS